MNGEIRGDRIVTKNFVNLGFAVELADGKGLIVPVVKNAETLNLLGMAKGIADIAARARSKQLTPDDVTGGSFTITNPGGYGTFHGTPIISQPQAAILGTYAIVKRPWVITDEYGRRRDRHPLADEPDADVRPSPGRRRVRRPLPARPARSASRAGARPTMLTRGAYLFNLGTVDYREAWSLQRSLAAAVIAGGDPGRRDDPRASADDHDSGAAPRRASCTCRTGAAVEVIETDRGGKSTYHAPGQLVCYPILDLNRYGKDVKKYCRDLEEALIRTIALVRRHGNADRGTDRRLARVAAAEDREHRHPPDEVGLDARLRAERRPRPCAVHRLDHGLRPRRLPVHLARPRARPARHGRRRTARSHRRRSPRSSIVTFEELPSGDAGLWAQPVHEQLARA